MSTFDYQEFIDVAKELLEEFGAELFIRRESAGQVSDPLEGTVTPGVVVDTSTMGVLLEIDEAYVKRNSGNRIEGGDKVVLLEPGLKPEESDKLVIGGTVWAIVKVNTVAPALVDILYEVQVRP